MITPQIYVGTYGKYNNGSIEGAWIDLSTHNEESFAIACNELHKAPPNSDCRPSHEFMYQDYEGFPSLFYSESGIDNRLWEYLTLDEHEQEVVAAFINCYGDCPNLFESADSAYYGTYDNDIAFAEELVESSGMLHDVPESLKQYFDYERYAGDLMFEFRSFSGFYFCNNW